MLRRAAIGVALGATLIMPLTACGSTPAPTSTAASPAPTTLPTPDAGDVLTAAVTKTTGVNLKVDLSDSSGDHYTGGYDGTNKVGALEQVGGGLKITVTPEEYYVSGIKQLKGMTWRLKIAKLRDESNQSVMTDILAPLTLLSQATGVQQNSPGTFTGHIDASLAKGAGAGTQKFLDHVNKSGGANAQTLIFTATVDSQGYLSSFKTTFPAFLGEGKDLDYELKLSDFGSPVNVVVPAGAKVVDAPDSAYKLM
jgi:hypothetical protein